MKITKAGQVIIEEGKPVTIQGFSFAFDEGEDPGMRQDELNSRCAEAGVKWAQDRLEFERSRAVKEVIRQMIAKQRPVC